MRTLATVSAAALLIGLAAIADAQAASPASSTATNSTAGNTHGAIAPRLPTASEDASASQFLKEAKMALGKGRTGAAQEALERAETRMLDRSTDPADSRTASNAPGVGHVRDALTALGHRDRAAADKAIDMAMASEMAATTPPTSSSNMPAMTAAPATAATAAPAASVPSVLIAPTTTSGSTTPIPAYGGNTASPALAGPTIPTTAATTTSGSTTATPAFSGTAKPAIPTAGVALAPNATSGSTTPVP